MTLLSRRLFLAGAAASVSTPLLAKPPADANEIVNPLVRQRADTQIAKHDDDGYYYMMATVPEYDRLVIRRARTLAGLSTAVEKEIWHRPESGKMAGYIWAPEMHRVNGKWHIYFGAGDGNDKFHVRMFVLVCNGGDLMTEPWTLLGQVETPWDTFTLDPTLFEHRGKQYLAWAQKEPGIKTNSNLYLAPLATPTTLAAKPARLSVPTYDWELAGEKVNEGPEILQRNGHVFMTYSAAATDARYCLGMLTAHDDADLMDAASWTKSPVPVFKSSAENKIFGPGHNSFTFDEHGRDMLVYLARDFEIGSNPLNDTHRDTHIQHFSFRPDGTPDFGVPVANGPLSLAERAAAKEHKASR